jgi:hypothetical protein
MAKTKYMMHECAYCHKQTKMELIGEGMQGEQPSADTQKLWYRCTRCKHSSLVVTSSSAAEKKSASAKIERNNCVEYAKEKTFTIGQEIYNSDLDDVGRVVRKDKTSNGIHSITVSFEKAGERKLLENITVEFSEDKLQPITSGV